MSYRVSYLLPKTEYERLTQGKRELSEVPKKKKRDKIEKKPKKEIRLRDKLRKMIKVKRKKKNKHTGEVKRKVPRKKQPQATKTVRPPAKRKLPPLDNPWSWDRESPERLNGPPPPKKPPDVGKFFDDSPKRKTKVMRLMKFIEKNKNHIMVNDDYEISVNNELIPGSDFIDIMNYLKSKPKDRRLAFHPTMNEKTNLPLGTQRFVDALHEAIEGERISGDMGEDEVNAFAKKLSNFAGMELDGLRKVVKGITDERERLVGEVRVQNTALELERAEDEEKEREEQERARNILKDIEEEERKVKQRKARDESDRTHFLNRQRKKNRQFNILRRIADHTEPDLVEARDLPAVEEEEGKVEKRRRRQLIRNLKTVGERINDELEKQKKPKTNIASRTHQYVMEGNRASPRATRKAYNVDSLGKIWTITRRRAGQQKVPIDDEEMLLEEESRRRPTISEILTGSDLSKIFDEEAAAAAAAAAAAEEEEEEERGRKKKKKKKKTEKK